MLKRSAHSAILVACISKNNDIKYLKSLEKVYTIYQRKWSVKWQLEKHVNKTLLT